MNCEYRLPRGRRRHGKKCTALADGFKSLGLSSDMIQKFASTAIEFLKDKGGDSIAGVLEGIVK